MIVFGLILLIVGYVIGFHILVTLGLLLLIVGIILALLGSTPYAVGGRRWWW